MLSLPYLCYCILGTEITQFDFAFNYLNSNSPNAAAVLPKSWRT